MATPIRVSFLLTRTEYEEARELLRDMKARGRKEDRPYFADWRIADLYRSCFLSGFSEMAEQEAEYAAVDDEEAAIDR